MIKFAFEDLEVWQKAVDFANKVILLTEGIQTNRKHYRLIEPIRGSLNVNIDEYSRRKGKIFQKGIHSVSLHCSRFIE